MNNHVTTSSITPTINTCNTGRNATALLGLLIAVSMALGVSAPGIARGFAAQHPRAAQLNGRFAQLNTRISGSYGNLSGHYVGLEQRDNAIQQTMARDSQANGGYITAAQRQRLDTRESNLQNSINQDLGN